VLEIKVVETEEFEFEGERCSIPTKIEINGREYMVEWEDGIEEIYELNVEDLKELRLGDIPEYLELNCESTDIGWLRLQRHQGYLEKSEYSKYWRENISIDNYFKLLKNMALRNGFEVINEFQDDNLYTIKFGKEFPEDATVEDVYETFQRLLDKTSVFEKIADAVVNTLVSVAVKLEGKV